MRTNITTNDNTGTVPFFTGLISFLLLLLAFSTSSRAQGSVTFKINLKPQLEDSIYVPGRDRIYLQGNLFPLSNTKKVYLKDTAPADSVYETTVNFPATSTGEELTFNYYIETPEKVKKEQMPRHLRLPKEDIELDVIYFNSFAW